MTVMNDELLIKYLLRETSQEEDLLVQKWINASLDNQRHISQFQKIWDTSKGLESKSSIDENEAWLRFKERASQPKTKEAVVRTIPKHFAWLRIAAVLLIAAAGAWSVYSYLLKTDYTTLAANDSVRIDTLPDGSEVTLNKNAVLLFQDNFEGNKRNVKLEKGEAFFKVEPDKAKPFEIEVDKVTITVVGTSFNVKHVHARTEVIVETGIVRVSKGKETVELHRGEKVNIKGDRGKLLKEANKDQLYNYYRSKEFIADDTPLWRVVEVLNEAYQANILIQNPQLRNLKLTTSFQDQSLDHILDIISKTFDIKVEKAPDRIILK
jgi:transmembrane sensor